MHQPKKLVIKNLRKKPELSEEYFELCLSRLKVGFKGLFEDERQKRLVSYEEMYRLCESLCTFGKSSKLTQLTSSSIETYINDYTPESVQNLQNLQKFWIDFQFKISLMRSIALRVDSLQATALQLLENNYFKGIHQSVFTNLLTLFDEIRIKGETISSNVSLAKSILQLISALGYYQAFIDALFEHSQKYFRAFASDLHKKDRPVEFLEAVDATIKAETTLYVNLALHQVSAHELLRIIDHELIEMYSRYYLCNFDLIISKTPLLLFTLLSRVNHMSQCLVSLSEFIKNRGMEILQMYSNLEQAQEFVSEMSLFKKLINDLQGMLIQIPSVSDDLVKHHVTVAFESFINQKSNLVAQLLAKYLDLFLKGKISLAADLDLVFTLFNYLDAKDMFEAFYKKDLSKRLIRGKSADFDSERQMLTRLRSECGSLFTNKLEGMFKDIELSRDFIHAFKSWKSYLNAKFTFDFQCLVLTDGYWPSCPPLKMDLPEYIIKCQTLFNDFYTQKYSGRRLTWMYSLSTCVLRLRMPSMTVKELHVSAVQANVLLLFSKYDELTVEQIQKYTGLTNDFSELERTLQSLALGKVRILNKSPRTKDVNLSDVFSFNHKFNSKQVRLKINSIQLREAQKKDTQATEEKVFADRQYVVDAAITRIMKSRKVCSFAGLMNEVVAICKFPITISDFQTRIDALIEREYLKKKDGDEMIIEYVA